MYENYELKRLEKICADKKKPAKLAFDFGDYLHLKLNEHTISYLKKIFALNLCPEEARLSFNHCESINEGLRMLFTVIAEAGCPRNLTITLQNNDNLDSDILRSLALALESGKCGNGFKISFMDNRLNTDDIALLAAALASGKMPEDLSLEFSRCSLDAIAAHHFSEALQSGRVKSGLYLGLDVNEIGDDGLKYFSDAFTSGKCPQNLSVNLWNNNIGPTGFSHLSKALESGLCPPKLSLNLRFNKLKAQGTYVLSNALASGKAPSHLTLIFGKEINAHSQSLAIMLASGRSPEYLHLQFNSDLSDSAITMLAAGIGSGHCSRGLQLDFSRCSLSAKSITLLLNTAKTGKSPENFTLHFEGDVFKSKQSPVSEVVNTIESPNLSKNFSLSMENCAITNEQIDSLIEAIKKQKPSRQFQFFVSWTATERQRAMIDSLQMRYTIQKIALLILGSMDPHSTIYLFDTNVLEYICCLTGSSKLPVFKAVKASMTDNIKYLPELGNECSNSSTPGLGTYRDDESPALCCII